MTGVIAGGPGAISWGDNYGAGPLIWTTVDGRDWVPATVERPSDADPRAKEPGSVLDVTAFGSGYVAIGRYVSPEEVTSLVWTSANGTDWRLVPEDPDLDHALIGDRLVAWQGRLLAFGCELDTPIDCGPIRVWSSEDGTSWTKIVPALPDEVGGLAYEDASDDRLWARGPAAGDQVWPSISEDTKRPLRLSSTDGRAWAVESLPILGIDRMHALPTGLFLTMSTVPRSPDFEPGPSWVSERPGVLRSTDKATWQPLVVDTKLGDEIVAVGDTLIMVGSAKPCPLYGDRCDAGAWRSTDGGATWESIPVTPNPAGITRAQMTRVAALSDGTLVAVGMEGGKDGSPKTAVWVSPPH